MKKLLTSILGIALYLASFAQAPQGFNYQAVIRDTEGQPISEQQVSIRLTLQDEVGEANHYAETHVLNTSPQGLVSLVVGNGTPVEKAFANIPWIEGNVYIKVEVDPSGGTSYTELGITKLQAVPYALHAQSANRFVADPGAVEGDPLFVVRNSQDQIVFAVYEQGVRVYVDGDPTDEEKGNKSGFAIGGLTGFKDTGEDYFRVSRAYTHVLFDTDAKGNKSGFAIGGLTGFKDQGNETYGNKSFGIKNTAGYMSITTENYFIGHESGQKTTEGLYNSFMGYESGYSNTTGSNNSFIGYRTGYYNLAGNSNTFLGDSSGFGNTSGSGNLFVGKNSGIANTIGNYNSFIGYESGYSNTTGLNNSFVGSYSGYSNISGSNNSFVGQSAGYYNETGDGNSFIGIDAGYSNTVGKYNSFLGYRTGYENDTASFNVFIGYQSGYNNTSFKNIFLGYQSGYNNESSNNVFIGTQAGKTNSTGYENVFLGNEAGYSNVGGGVNVFIGHKTGWFNQNGGQNVFMGFVSGYKNTDGMENTYLGDQCGYSGTSASANVFVGATAGWYNTASENVFIGKSAGFYNTFGGITGDEGSRNVFVGRSSGLSNTKGYFNTSVGYKSLYSNTTGTYNTALGYLAFEGGAEFTNSTALGNGATIGESNQVRIGNSSVTSAWVQVAWSVGSDERIKENVNENVPGLDFIKLLRPVTFNYNISKQNEIQGATNNFECDSKYDIEKILYSGFIAQEVEKAAESIGYNFSGIDKSGTLMGLKYSSFTIPLVKAVQELNEKNEQQQKIIEIQHMEIESLKSEIEAIKAIIGK